MGVYIDETDVRPYLGNLSTQISADVINFQIDAAEAQINGATGASADDPWTETDNEFAEIKKVAAWLAASGAMVGIQNMEVTRDSLITEANNILSALVKSDTTGPTTDFVDSSSAVTFPSSQTGQIWASSRFPNLRKYKRSELDHVDADLSGLMLP